MNVIARGCLTLLASALLSGTSLAASSNYGPWNDPANSPGAFSPQATKDALQALTNGTGSVDSPNNWYSQDASLRYKPSKTLVIAHRGMVDLFNGIPENSYASVINAINNHIYMVEVDVQVSSDGIAIAAHDETAFRNTRLSKKINTYTASMLSQETIMIRNPLFYVDANHQFSFNTDQKITTIKSLMDRVLEKYPGVTFFLDPKNLPAAKAVADMVIEEPSLAKHIVMKTYSDYWIKEIGSRDLSQASASVYSRCGTNHDICQELSQMRIMPVDNMGNLAELCHSVIDADCQSAADKVIKDVNGWGRYFEVQAIELPRAWDTHWIAFATAVKLKLDSHLFLYNQGYLPVISAGYRYEDFALTRPREPNQQFGNTTYYDWNMDGKIQPDTGNPARRTACGQKSYITGFGGNYVTTDYPLAELACTNWPTIYRNPIEGNPVDIFQIGNEIISVPESLITDRDYKDDLATLRMALYYLW
jgi:glycerophosphoryl diester phosphodiesterase